MRRRLTEMKEKKVLFGQGDILLEGNYALGGAAMGAVISHPHPLMGGNMDNPVVEILSETLLNHGISTLRFNFRGVGKSTGSFDNGRGEQEDILAAISYMEGQGIQEIMPVGYSFGAWVSAGILNKIKLLPALFVAPPLNLFSFDAHSLQGKVGLMICGDHDAYCPTALAKSVAGELACNLAIVPGADHFFQLHEPELARCINDYAGYCAHDKK